MVRVGTVNAATSTFSTDGAEMGNAMVAEGLGITALPDYSVIVDLLPCRVGAS